MVNMPPSQLFLRPVAGMFLSLNIYVIYVLLWIKYWLVIWNYFSFYFIQIEKMS